MSNRKSTRMYPGGDEYAVLETLKNNHLSLEAVPCQWADEDTVVFPALRTWLSTFAIL